MAALDLTGLRACGSFLDIEEWLEDPRHMLGIRFAEFSNIEFGPIDHTFPQSWSADLLLHGGDMEYLRFGLVQTPIVSTSSDEYFRGNLAVIRHRVVMLVDDFPALAVVQRLTGQI
jgi:hypothetical protein